MRRIEMLARIRHEEQGLAMVMALMVTFVVLLMSLVVLAQATHNIQASGYDRKRLTSVGAAEAGIDYMYNYFQKTAASALATDPVASVVTLGTSPNTVTYDTSATYYGDASGTIACGTTPPSGTISTCQSSATTFSNTNRPSSVKVRSVGTSSDGTKRLMESFIALRPVTGGTAGAIVTNSDTTFTNNFTVTGVDSDVYVLTGNFTAPSGQASINGSLYVPTGSATLGTSMTLSGQVFARDAVALSHPQIVIGGDVKSSTKGVAQTGGTVLGLIHYCSSGGFTAPSGAVNDCPSPVPGAGATFPHLTYDTATWTTTQDDGKRWSQVIPTPAGGKNQCEVARDAIAAGVTPPSGYTGVVYYITDSTCVFSTNNGSIPLNGDIAVVATGGINLGNHPIFTGVGGTRQLVLMAPWPSSGTPTCPASGTVDVPYTVAVGNHVEFDSSTVKVLVYGACGASMLNNNSSFSGQVIAQNTLIGNQFSMNYQEISVPGRNISGFKEDVAYIREVVCQNPTNAMC
jgi:Tfp pilus assembly protein PilX